MDIEIKVLIVEDSDDDAMLLLEELGRSKYKPIYKRVETEADFKHALESEEWDLVVSDYSLPHFNGLEAIRVLRETKPDIPLVLVSGTIGEDVAVECMKAGAADYLMKDNLIRFNVAVERVLKDSMIKKERKTVGARLELFRGIIEQSQDMIFISDASTGSLLDFNEEVHKRLGYSRKELMNMKVMKIISDADIKDNWDFQVRKIKEKGGSLIEHQIKTRENNIFDAQVSLNVVSHGDNEYVIGIARDITERKNAEREIRKEKEKLQMYLDIAEVGFLVINKDETVGLVNPKLAEILGCSQEEILGKNWFDNFVSKKDRKGLRKIFWKIMGSKIKGSEYNENIVVKSNGEEKIIAWHNTKMETEDGNIIGILSSAVDITDRKKAERFLKKQEEKYRLITENSKDLIAMTTFDRHVTYTYVSPSHKKILGYSPEELMGASGLALVHPEDRKQIIKRLTKYMIGKAKNFISADQENPSEQVEYRFKRKSGGWVDIEAVATLVGGKILFVSRDISERKKMQEVLIESEKLASIGALVAEITHEINNPLQIMTGRAQLGLMDKIEDKGLEEDLRIILEEGMKTKDIIERLLKFSKTSKGKIKAANINEVILEIIKLVSPQYALADIKFKKSFTPVLPGIEIDERQIQEVLLNLMNNAAQSMLEGGVIFVATSKEDDNIKIDITDTGKGIPEENIRRLFEPFFTTKEKGTGLGLSVCYGIVKAHGGEVKFNSKVNKGTTVTVLLPLNMD